MGNDNIIKLKGGGIVKIDTETIYEAGCETCDYGSSYTNYIDFYFSSGNEFDIIASRMYEYICSEFDIIRIVCDRPSDLDEAGFCNYFLDELKLLCEDRQSVVPSISCRFYGADKKLIKSFTVYREADPFSTGCKKKWVTDRHWKKNKQKELKTEETTE